MLGFGDLDGNPLNPVEPGSKRMPAIMEVMGLDPSLSSPLTKMAGGTLASHTPLQSGQYLDSR